MDLDGSTKQVKCGNCFSPTISHAYRVHLQSQLDLIFVPFRLQAVIFPYFVAHLFIFISLFFSSYVMGDDKRKRKRRSPKGPLKPRTVWVSHCNKDVNQWKEHIIKQCLEEYYKEFATNNNIPQPSTEQL